MDYTQTLVFTVNANHASHYYGELICEILKSCTTPTALFLTCGVTTPHKQSVICPSTKAEAVYNKQMILQFNTYVN